MSPPNSNPNTPPPSPLNIPFSPSSYTYPDPYAPLPLSPYSDPSAAGDDSQNSQFYTAGNDNSLSAENNQSDQPDDSFFSFENDSNFNFLSFLTNAGNTSPPPQLDFQPHYAATSSLPHIPNPGDWRANLPVGMKFRPTDEELIIHYLKPHILHGASRPDGPISVADIYKYEPHELQDLGEDHGDGKRYFITPVKKIGKSKTHRFLENNKGFWKPTQAPKPIFSTTLHGPVKVGEKTPLAFYSEDKRKTQWLMQEFRLPKNDDESSQNHEEKVLVVVYNHERNAKRKRDDEEHEA